MAGQALPRGGRGLAMILRIIAPFSPGRRGLGDETDYSRFVGDCKKLKE
jgi:hypothetical protein